MIRLLRASLLLLLGAFAGLAGAAVALRAWLAWRGTGHPSDDVVEVMAIFDGAQVENRSSALRGGRVLAWFGGVTLDLGGATLAPGAELDVRALFGGVRVIVPPGCRVEPERRFILGGLSVSAPAPTDPDAPVLRVRAIGLLGGISIHA
jgi:hypothetical protein